MYIFFTKVTWDYLLSICFLFCVYVCILTLCLCSSLCTCITVPRTLLLCSSIFCVENKGSRNDNNWLAPVRMHVTYFKSRTGIIDRKLLKFSPQFVITGKLRKMTLTLPRFGSILNTNCCIIYFIRLINFFQYWDNLDAFAKFGNLLSSMDLFNSWVKIFLKISKLLLLILSGMYGSWEALQLLKFTVSFSISDSST